MLEVQTIVVLDREVSQLQDWHERLVPRKKNHHMIHGTINPYREDAYELGYKLADQIYDSIRESDTGICDIAQNLGFKADNIKNVKDHVF